MGRIRVSVGRSFHSLRVIDSEALDNMINYFVDINNRFHGADFFRDQWESLGRYKLNPKQLSIIIERSGQLVQSLEDQSNDVADTMAQELKQIALDNLHRWEQQAVGQIPFFEPVDLSHCYKGFSELGIKPTTEIYRQLFSRIQERAHDFRPIDYGIHYNCAARLGAELPRMLGKELLDRIRACDSFWEKQRKTDFVWALAVQDSIFPKTEYAQIAGLIRHMLPTIVRGKHVQKMRHDTAKWFRWEGDFPNVERRPTHSSIEDDVRKLFERAGLKTEVLSSPIPEFPQAIDWSVTDGERRVHVEIDAHESHHLEAAGQIPALRMNPHYTGPDLFRSALLGRETTDPILRIPRPISFALGDKRNRLHVGEEAAKLMAKIFFSRAANGPAKVSRAVLLGCEPRVAAMTPSGQ
ncbi:MAG: hypothetical protein AAF988_00015 [Pseudomonadota bacterium]